MNHEIEKTRYMLERIGLMPKSEIIEQELHIPPSLLSMKPKTRCTRCHMIQDTTWHSLTHTCISCGNNFKVRRGTLLDDLHFRSWNFCATLNCTCGSKKKVNVAVYRTRCLRCKRIRTVTPYMIQELSGFIMADSPAAIAKNFISKEFQ